MSDWIQSGNHPEVEVNLAKRQVRYTRSKRVLKENEPCEGSRFFTVIIGAREGRLEAGYIMKQVRVAELAAEASGYGPVRMVNCRADPWQKTNWAPAESGADRVNARSRPVRVTDIATGEVVEMVSHIATVRWLSQRGVKTTPTRLCLAFRSSQTAEIGGYRLLSYS